MTGSSAESPAETGAGARSGTEPKAGTLPRPAPAMRGRLGRFRVVSYVVGVFLLVLTLVAMPLKYLGDNDAAVAVVGPVHGFLYMVYLVVGADLALRARWSLRGTALVLLAGTVPFMSFYAERVVTRRVRHGQRL
jgi:integral membrane protein